MTNENNRYCHDDRRAALLETARTVFLEQGYSATTMEDIAARHGVSKTTLYKYFPSKNDLFNAIVEAQSAEISKRLNVFAGMASDIRTVLQCFCSRCLTIMLSPDMVAFERLIVAEARSFPETAKAAYELGFKPALDYWEIIIREAIAAGQLRQTNARTATEYLLAMSNGPLMRLRQWGIMQKVTPAMIDYHAKVVASIFLAAFGNDKLAHEARSDT